MSEITAIVLLATVGFESKREFRVAQVHGDWDVSAEADFPSYNPRFNQARVHEMFRDSPEFTDAWEALLYWRELKREIGTVECNLVILDFSDIPFPTPNNP